MLTFLPEALFPLPPDSILRIFHYDPGIGELFADDI
jgi:hypothetical protein